MSQVASVRVTVTVEVEPAAAFDVFTGELDTWYRRGATVMTGRASSGLRLEPGVGGRLVEVGPAGEEGSVRGRVTVWEPGRRLVFVDRKETEVDVRFEAVARGTRVVLEHRGLDRLRPDQADNAARWGWRRLVEWFEVHVQMTEETKR
jgi:hypothetical protein